MMKADTSTRGHKSTKGKIPPHPALSPLGRGLKVRGRHYFTLIELMVAITLMLLLMAIMLQTFSNANQVSRKTQAWIEIHQNARSLFEFMERDISGAILVGVTSTATPDGKYFQVEGDTYLDGVSGVPGMSHYRDNIRLLTRTMNPGYADMAEVGYYLDVPDTDDVRKNVLQRWIDYVSDDTTDGDDLTIATLATDTVWASGKSKGKDVIATGVTDLDMKYDGTNFPALTNLTTLPNSIEITAYITDSNGIFLYQDTPDRDHPFCGSGIKFVHIVLVRQE